MRSALHGPGFEQFGRLRGELAGLASQLEAVAGELGQATMVRSVAELRESVLNDTFTVLVVGEFNAGKSTTINAMLGDKVLPAKGNPTTAVLSVVRWGEQPQAELFARDPGSPGGLDGTAVRVDVDDLTRYIVIDDSKEFDKWGKVEIRWPLELCRQGVDIVDSPGLNEDQARESITKEFVDRADAVIFVFSALQALTMSERDFIDEYLKLFRHDNIFFLVNRINQVDEEEVEEVVHDFRSRAREFWDAGDERVMFVDALGALKARQRRRPEDVDASGLLAFERALERFLTTERGRLKILPPALRVQRLVGDARSRIDEMFTLHDADLEKLNVLYEKQRGPLETQRRDGEIILRTFENHLAATRALVEESALRCLNTAAALCGDWANEVERQHKVTLNPVKARQNLEAGAKEVSDGLSERIQRHVTAWHEGELTELVVARTADLDKSVSEQLKSFVRGLEEIRLSFLELGEPAAHRAPSDMERMLSFGAGLLLDPGSAVVGAQFGFKAVLKGALPQFGVAVGLALLGFGPGALAVALFGTGMLRSVLKLDKFNQQVVDGVAEEAARKLRDEAPERAREIAGRIHVHLDVIRQEIERGVAEGLAEVQETVESVLRKREDSRQTVEEARRSLRAHRVDLGEIEKRALAVVEQWVREG